MKMRKIGVGDIVISKKAKEYVKDVLDTNRLSYGPYSRKFEAKFARMHNCKNAVFSNSGTDSLRLSLQALKELGKWNDGDEVIVPAITFIASSNVIIQNNLKPVFVDVKLETYNINPEKIKEAITPKTRAIMPVHLMGLPCDMDPIWELAKKHKLKIIEDSCESMLAEYKGKKVGSLGDVGCFSTYVAHLLVTGVGGLSTTNDKKIATKIRSLMNHGRDPYYLSIDDDDNARGEDLFKIVAKRFNYMSVGHSARCTEMEAALGLDQLSSLEEIVAKRQGIAKKFIKNLSHLSDHIQLPTIPKNRTHSFMLFPILLKNEKKEGLIRYLEKRGIETRDLMPLLNQPIYKKLFGNIESNYPNALKIRKNGFYIGCHQYLSNEDIKFITTAINSYFK
jgi:perosamine synthetase